MNEAIGCQNKDKVSIMINFNYFFVKVCGD